MTKKVLIFSLLIMSFFGAYSQNCNKQYGETEDDSLQCLAQISMFRVNYDGKNYAEAYKAWREIITICPCSWSGIFSYAPNMLSNIIKAEQDSARRERLIDTLIWSYENRHIYFPDRYTEGNGLAYRCMAQLQYQRIKGLGQYKALIDTMGIAIDMEQAKIQPSIWNTYFNLAEKITKATKDTTMIIEAYERATTYIEIAIQDAQIAIDKRAPNFLNLDSARADGRITEVEYQKKFVPLSKDTARNHKLMKTYKRALGNIEIVFTPYAPCNVLEKVYTTKMETPLELNTYKKMLHTLNKSKCMGSPVYVQLLDIVHKAEPSAETAYYMGLFTLGNGETDKAIAFFQEAISLFEVNDKKADAHYRIALAKFLQQKYSESRAEAMAAVKLNPKYGVAYILIGDLYAASGNRCSGDDQCPLGYMWAAADKYNKALAVDPSLAEKVREARSKLRFPTGDDKFKRGLNNGDTYRVGCWIQENTIVR